MSNVVSGGDDSTLIEPAQGDDGKRNCTVCVAGSCHCLAAAAAAAAVLPHLPLSSTTILPALWSSTYSNSPMYPTTQPVQLSANSCTLLLLQNVMSAAAN